MGFLDAMRGGLALNEYVQQGFREGDERKKQNSLAQLAGDYYANPQQNTLAQLARLDPSAAAQAAPYGQKLEAQHQQEIGQSAALLLTLPKEQQAAFYAAKIQPYLREKGLEAPDWSDALIPTAQKVAEMWGGADGIGNRVQSTYVDGAGNRYAIMRDGSQRMLGKDEPNVQLVDTANGWNAVDKTQAVARPVTVGQGQGVPPPDKLGAIANAMIAKGIPADQVDAILAEVTGVPFEDAPPEGPVLETGTKPPEAERLAMERERLRLAQNADARAAAGGGTKAPSGYRYAADGKSLEPIPGGPAQAALDAKAAATEAKITAARTRQAEAASQATDLINAIDTLTKAPGFSDLGTAWGDVQINAPMVRNDAKDANAQLKNVAGQIALTTMSRLKALSSTGATGFGSLTEKELTLLQNAIATLQSEDISNAQLASSLATIKTSMKKIADWQPTDASPAAPASSDWSAKRVK